MDTKLRTNIYISPHFDDAVFSCPLNMINDIKNGYRVIVITVFSNSGPSSTTENILRRTENNNALNLLKAESIELGYNDAPYRHNYYNNFNRIVFERHSDDGTEFVKSISTKILSLCEQYSPEIIYAPLGIGTHIDHRICFEATKQLIDYPIYYYEDRPYCFTRYAVEARLKTLEIDLKTLPQLNSMLNKQDIDNHLNSLITMPYVKEYLTTTHDRGTCFNALALLINANYPHTYTATDKIVSSSSKIKTSILTITSSYKSQILPFLGSIDEYSEQLDKYSNSLSKNQKLNERYWILFKNS